MFINIDEGKILSQVSSDIWKKLKIKLRENSVNSAGDNFNNSAVRWKFNELRELLDSAGATFETVHLNELTLLIKFDKSKTSADAINVLLARTNKLLEKIL